MDIGRHVAETGLDRAAGAALMISASGAERQFGDTILF
jgi:hypothetical protein